MNITCLPSVMSKNWHYAGYEQQQEFLMEEEPKTRWIFARLAYYHNKARFNHAKGRPDLNERELEFFKKAQDQAKKTIPTLRNHRLRAHLEWVAHCLVTASGTKAEIKWHKWISEFESMDRAYLKEAKENPDNEEYQLDITRRIMAANPCPDSEA